MYSVLTRGNAILTYTLSVLACLTFLCFLSTLTVDYRTNAQINTVKVVVKNVPDFAVSREKNDLGFLTFDLKTDLSHLFNWNVKQLFLYLTAEYITSNNELNQVVLWDKIILRGENAVLDFKNMNTKYYFWDDGNGLKGHSNVTLSLSWNIIPNAGLLPNVQAIGQHSFKFPVEYTQTRNLDCCSGVWFIVNSAGIYPYHYTPLYVIDEGDPVRRLDFCRFMLNADLEDPSFLRKMLWTDESKFDKDGITKNQIHFWTHLLAHLRV